MNTAEAVAATLRQLAEDSGISTVALSEQSGVPRASLIRKLNKTPQHLTVDEVDAVAGVLGSTYLGVAESAARLTLEKAPDQ